jgi:hypothetical protein
MDFGITALVDGAESTVSLSLCKGKDKSLEFRLFRHLALD